MLSENEQYKLEISVFYKELIVPNTIRSTCQCSVLRLKLYIEHPEGRANRISTMAGENSNNVSSQPNVTIRVLVATTGVTYRVTLHPSELT